MSENPFDKARKKFYNTKGAKDLGGFSATIKDTLEREKVLKERIRALAERIRDDRGLVCLFFTFEVKKVNSLIFQPKDIEAEFINAKISSPEAFSLCAKTLKEIVPLGIKSYYKNNRGKNE